MRYVGNYKHAALLIVMVLNLVLLDAIVIGVKL